MEKISKIKFKEDLIKKIVKKDEYFQKKFYEVLLRIVKEFPHLNSTKKIANFYRRHITESPDWILLFEFVRDESGIILWLWDIVNHDEYERAKINILRKKKRNWMNEISKILKIEVDVETIKEEEIDKTDEFLPGRDMWFYTLDPPIIGSYEDYLEQFKKDDLEPIFTEEQICALNETPPLLLQGTSGTGKTLILLYYLKKLKRASPNAKICFITLLSGIAEEVKEEFGSRIKGIKDINFKGIYELFWEIVNQYSGRLVKFDENRLIDYKKFVENWHRERRGQFNFPSDLLWEEIRGTLLGSSKEKKLSKEDYINKIGERESNFGVKERENVYKAFENYLEWKKENAFWDHADLAWECLEITKNKNIKLYDAIAVDEVQDLTEREISVLINLCKTSYNMFFAGDVNQKLFPSGFRWHFVNKAIESITNRNPQKKELTLNYNLRCKPKIVELGNLFLKKMEEIEKREDLKQIAKSQNYVPWSFENEEYIYMVLVNSPKKVEEFVSKIWDLPNRVIIFPTEELKLKNKNFTFALMEFKGLEREKVVLVNMFHWANQESKKNGSSWEENLFFLQRFYVAVTRSIKELWFIDCCKPPEWIEGSITYKTAEELFKLQEVNPMEWEEAGLWYERRNKKEASIEAFKKAAVGYEKAGIWDKYAEMCEKLEEYEEIGRIYEEKLNDYEKAKEYYNKAKENYKKTKRWDKYAEMCEKSEEYEEAAKTYEEKLKNYAKAKENYKKAKRWDKYTEMCEKSEEYEEAAKTYEEKLKNYAKAKENYKKAKRWDKYIEMCEKLEEYEEAAKTYEEKLKNYAKAKENYKKAKRWDKYTEMCEKLEEYEEAGKVYGEILKDYEKTKENYKKAIIKYYQEGNFEKVREIYENYFRHKIDYIIMHPFIGKFKKLTQDEKELFILYYKSCEKLFLHIKLSKYKKIYEKLTQK
jgi:tetratricopeptide (TPR) repeat protein